MTRKSIALSAIEEILSRKRVHKVVRPPELVEWDRTHGKRILPAHAWNDRLAARRYRLQKAREIIWSLFIVAENTKVHALYNLRAKHNSGQRGYVELRQIITDGKLPVVVQELKVRHRNLLAQYEFLGQPIRRVRNYADKVFETIAKEA